MTSEEKKSCCCCEKEKEKEKEFVRSQAKEYYGSTLQGTKDLKTSACTCSAKPPEYIARAIALVHDEVASHYYGCGLVVPEVLEGLTCLDLGCGAGRDVYVLSKLVGEKGSVVGVDMTAEQLAIAARHADYHAKAFGYAQPNVRFVQGIIEDLQGIASASVDVVVSNCVVNLSPDKRAVLAEAFRVLKPGGEMYFSDVYSDRRIPPHLLHDPVLHGECLSGALYWNDFLSLARSVGFADPRLVTSRPIALDNADIQAKIGFANFCSATYRLFKIDGLEQSREDYGQAVVYKGTVPTSPDAFVLDQANRMERGRVHPVCGNTYRMLHDTRFAPHFDFIGNFDTHFGLFASDAAQAPFATTTKPCCCC